MTTAVHMVDVTRGGRLESSHLGHAVVMHADGDIVHQWGNENEIIFPRSSCKMIQALPLVRSEAGARLSSQQLALACASHIAERDHVARVDRWLADLDLDAHTLCCGPQPSRDESYAHDMIRAGEPVTRAFNWCSGKHAGFLTLTRHLNAGLDYVDPDHPVQTAVKVAFEDATEMVSPGFGIDGCSAPNHATSLVALARAMAKFAGAKDGAEVRLREAMMAHPELVAGTGQACTELMNAAKTPYAVKTGAEGVYVAILPSQKLGIAIKIIDGATRAAECVMAALLVKLGALDAENPIAKKYTAQPIINWDGLHVGDVRAAYGAFS